MTIEEDLIRPIQDDPDHDAPRLVAADWLEERGDARAEFIRIQCELEQIVPVPERSWGDYALPLYRTEGPWAPLVRREIESFIRRAVELLVRFEGEWVGPLWGTFSSWRPGFEKRRPGTLWPGWTPRPGWTFRRGFVEEVTLTAEAFLAHAEVLFRLAPIVRVLRLVELRPQDVPSWAASPHLARLVALNIPRGLEDPATMRAVARSPFLSRLRELALPEHELGSEALAELVSSPCMARLTRLDLSNNQVGDEGVRLLAGSASSARLVELNLTGNRLGRAGVEALARSPHLAQLATLRLGCRSTGGRGFPENRLPDDFPTTLADTPGSAPLTTVIYDEGGHDVNGEGRSEQVVEGRSRSILLRRINTDFGWW